MERKPMKSLVFDLRWHDAIQGLSSFDREQMYEAICQYAKDGTEADVKDPVKRMALRIIYDQIDDQRSLLKETEGL